MKTIWISVIFMMQLWGNSTTLERNGWNLISVCQDMNINEVNMSNIQEIQNQEGKSIYTGEFANYSNLKRLEAGYGYWVKGDSGVTFDGGEANSSLKKPLKRTGWNLMASCEEVAKADINMTDIEEIQAQDGHSLYSGNDAQHSNLDRLLNGYGYWVKGREGTLFQARGNVDIPTNVNSPSVGRPFTKKIVSDIKNSSFSLINAPEGMTINSKTGVIYWTPMPNQIGEVSVDINVSGTIQTLSLVVESGTVDLRNALFISPNGDDKNDGTYDHPLKDTKKLCTNDNTILENKTIYYRGGLYTNANFGNGDKNNDSAPRIRCSGTSKHWLTIKPWGNEKAKIKFDSALGVRLTGNYVKFQGFEVEGVANEISYEEAVANWWIGDRYYNGSGIVTNGHHVEISNNIVHATPASGISAQDGDFVTIKNNIVYDCDWWTIAGSKGIGVTNATSSDGSTTSQNIKIENNLIFNVESRVISRVWSKGKAHLTIDEGEGILVQINDANYTGRYLIKNNFLLFTGKGIVVNKTDKADLVHNTLYQTGTTIAGNFKGLRGNSTDDTNITGNAVSIVPYGYAYNMGGGSTNLSYGRNCFEGNETVEIESFKYVDRLFPNASRLDFTTSSECIGLGASQTVWNALKAKADSYGIEIKPTNWKPNYVDVTRRVIKAIPKEATVDWSTWNDSEAFDLHITNLPDGIDGRPTNFVLEVVHPYHRENVVRALGKKIEEDFTLWSLNLNGEQLLEKEGAIDTNGTSYRWVASHNKILLNKKGNTKSLFQKITTQKGLYFLTLFDTNNSTKPREIVDLSKPDAAVVFENSGYEKFDYFVMLFDGQDWFVSENSFDRGISLSEVHRWRHVVESNEITSRYEANLSLPYTLTFDEEKQIDLTKVQGMGLYYNALKSAGFWGYTLKLYESLKPASFYLGMYSNKKEVSPLLFGIAVRPGYWKSDFDEMLNHLQGVATLIRWPGGSSLERWNIKEFKDRWSVNYFVDTVRAKLPNVELLIGVPSTLAMYDDAHQVNPYTINTDLKTYFGKTVPIKSFAGEYANELVNYLNIDYNEPWGNNKSISQSANIHYLEIGNEFDLEMKNVPPEVNVKDLYGGALTRYASAVNDAHPNIKLVGPITTAGSMDKLIDIVKRYGEHLDVVGTHRYSDNPTEYKKDIKIMKSSIDKYMHDNSRRKKSEVKIAYTEYNSLPDTRGGKYADDENWTKAIWHAWTFGTLVNGGVDIAVLWHVSMGGGHAMFRKIDGHYQPLPIYYSWKFYRDNIDFTKHPKVLKYDTIYKDLKFTPIEMEDKIVVFVVNTSRTQNKTITLDFGNSKFANTADIKTMSKGTNGTWDIGVVTQEEQALNSDFSLTYTFNAQTIYAIYLKKL